jgi:hypothetical protein
MRAIHIVVAVVTALVLVQALVIDDLRRDVTRLKLMAHRPEVVRHEYNMQLKPEIHVLSNEQIRLKLTPTYGSNLCGRIGTKWTVHH